MNFLINLRQRNKNKQSLKLKFEQCSSGVRKRIKYLKSNLRQPNKNK